MPSEVSVRSTALYKNRWNLVKANTTLSDGLNLLSVYLFFTKIWKTQDKFGNLWYNYKISSRSALCFCQSAKLPKHKGLCCENRWNSPSCLDSISFMWYNENRKQSSDREIELQKNNLRSREKKVRRYRWYATGMTMGVIAEDNSLSHPNRFGWQLPRGG